eukprot:scaffold6067_cov112-Isochrysis_galbana.AAC.15
MGGRVARGSVLSPGTSTIVCRTVSAQSKCCLEGSNGSVRLLGRCGKGQARASQWAPGTFDRARHHARPTPHARACSPASQCKPRPTRPPGKCAMRLASR